MRQVPKATRVELAYEREMDMLKMMDIADDYLHQTIAELREQDGFEVVSLVVSEWDGRSKMISGVEGSSFVPVSWMLVYKSYAPD